MRREIQLSYGNMLRKKNKIETNIYCSKWGANEFEQSRLFGCDGGEPPYREIIGGGWRVLKRKYI